MLRSARRRLARRLRHEREQPSASDRCGHEPRSSHALAWSRAVLRVRCSFCVSAPIRSSRRPGLDGLGTWSRCGARRGCESADRDARPARGRARAARRAAHDRGRREKLGLAQLVAIALAPFARDCDVSGSTWATSRSRCRCRSALLPRSPGAIGQARGRPQSAHCGGPAHRSRCALRLGDGDGHRGWTTPRRGMWADGCSTPRVTCRRGRELRPRTRACVRLRERTLAWRRPRAANAAILALAVILGRRAARQDRRATLRPRVGSRRPNRCVSVSLSTAAATGRGILGERGIDAASATPIVRSPSA